MSYNLEVFNLPKTGPQSAAGKPAPAVKKTATPAPPAGSNSGNDSRGYDLSSFHLPETVEIPKHSTDGKEATETIYIRDLGKHVRAQVEDALRVSPESAVTALHWQIGTAKGASLMDESTLEHFQKLGSEFAASKPKDRKGYFQKSIVPFLNGLTAGKRR